MNKLALYSAQVTDLRQLGGGFGCPYGCCQVSLKFQTEGDRTKVYNNYIFTPRNDAN